MDRLTGKVIPVKERVTYRELLKHNSINCSSVLMRRETARRSSSRTWSSPKSTSSRRKSLINPLKVARIQFSKRLFDLSENPLFENYGIIVLSVFRPVDERDVSALKLLFDEIQKFVFLRVRLEFGDVSLGELLEFIQVMTEPLPQFVRRGDLFRPEIEAGVLLLDPSRP